MTKIMITGIAVTILTICVAVADYGFTKHATHRCLTLVTQASEYPDYYLTQNEADMCAHVGITVLAPTK